MTNDNSMIGQMDPGPEKLATFLLHHFNDLRVAPSSALDSCGLSRALWTELRQGKNLSLAAHRKLAAGLSIPLLKLCLMSGLISGLEALNVQSPTVQEEIKGITTKSPVQFWRLTESEGELIRLFRYIDSQRGRELIRDVAMGQVRLSNHKNSVLLEEDVEMIDSIINQEVKKESTDG
tara:strand:- start:572 stop:1105 length:534 start_codon:yes stop_codon:yes gene_type:complete